jgi:hypothetical protein
MEQEEESKQGKKKPNALEKQMSISKVKVKPKSVATNDQVIKKVRDQQKNSLMETANTFKALGSKELCGQNMDFVKEVM